MRALFRLAVLYMVAGVYIGIVKDAYASSCVERAFKETKAARGNQPKLNALYEKYFGEALAVQAAGAKWKKMSIAEQGRQKYHARKVVLSLTGQLARYADAIFTWRGNVATVRLKGDTSQITARFARGCVMRDVCVKDVGCLSSYIGDYRKRQRDK